MKHQDEPFLEIFVDVEREKVVEFASTVGYVKMIPFKGTAQGKLFTGLVEPCGVDTQITNQNEVRHMSARYMLTGTDFKGQPCRIYIENNGYFTGGETPRPFRTVPTFYTDSNALAPFLHTNRFVGEGQRDEQGLFIRFYELVQE